MNRLINAFVSAFVFTFALSISVAEAKSERSFPTEQEYKQINLLLQFLYKIDGNLPNLNESKIKRLEYIHNQVFNDFALPDREKKKLWEEAWTDPDYHVWRLRVTHQQAIEATEMFLRSFPLEALLKRQKRFFEAVKRQRKVDPYEDDPFIFANRCFVTNDILATAVEAQDKALEQLQALNAAYKLERTGLLDEDMFYKRTMLMPILKRIGLQYLMHSSYSLRESF